jgi:hypothetical protein
MTIATTETDAQNAARRYNWGMNPEYVKKKWQNLVHKKCIKCDARLEEKQDRVVLYVCTDPDCDFFITRRKLFEILTDENHILRRYLTEHERIELEEAVSKAEGNVLT